MKEYPHPWDSYLRLWREFDISVIFIPKTHYFGNSLFQLQQLLKIMYEETLMICIYLFVFFCFSIKELLMLRFIFQGANELEKDFAEEAADRISPTG